MRRVVQQNVSGHQRRIGIKPKRMFLGVTTSLVLELGHPVHPTDAGDAVENPAKFGVGRHLRLIKQNGFGRIKASCQIPSGDFACGFCQFRRVLPNRDRVHINHTINCFHLPLHADEPFDRAKIVAKLQAARGFDP